MVLTIFITKLLQQQTTTNTFADKYDLTRNGRMGDTFVVMIKITLSYSTCLKSGKFCQILDEGKILNLGKKLFRKLTNASKFWRNDVRCWIPSSLDTIPHFEKDEKSAHNTCLP